MQTCLKSYMTIVAAGMAIVTGCTQGPYDDGESAMPLGRNTALGVVESAARASSNDAPVLDLSALADAETEGVETEAFEPEGARSVGCAGVESARWGGRYSCKGALYVTARNTCNRRVGIEICVEKWVGAGRRKMDCGLMNVGAGRTWQNWTCDATGNYTIRAREPF